MTYTKFDIPDEMNCWGGDLNPAIFVFAHQDDETLTLGAEIEYHKTQGRYVIGVLGTDGRSSAVRPSTGLDNRNFVKARNLELLNALQELGVDEVHFSGGKDGSLTQLQADAIANFWFQRYPSAAFKVPSDKDSHPDHKALGVAFRKIKTANPSADIRFYVKPEQWTTIGVPLNWTVGGATTVAAANQYKIIDIPNGRYGIGYQSDPGAFLSIFATPKSGWHF